MKQIYLDNNATTQIDVRVREAMESELREFYGNPSSVHSFGQACRKRLTQARHSIASFLQVKANELVFTSGGTESLNMVIRGLVEAAAPCHVISSSVEHSAVYSTLKLLEESGAKVDFIPPGLSGAVTPAAVKAALRPNTRLISLMAVNNETGVKTDIEGIAEIAKEAKVPFLVDGVALLGKELFTIPSGVSAMCFSGHKFHAPKGIGLAFIRNSLKLRPLITGGDQEYGRRGGTENIPGIIAMAKAIELLSTELPQAEERMEMLRDRLESELMQRLDGVSINGKGPRVVNTSNLSFEGVEGETLLTTLDLEGIAVSHGSACSSGALEPSRILLNMGIDPKIAQSSIRFSLSRFTTLEEINSCIDVVVRLIIKMRKSLVR